MRRREDTRGSAGRRRGTRGDATRRGGFEEKRGDVGIREETWPQGSHRKRIPEPDLDIGGEGVTPLKGANS